MRLTDVEVFGEPPKKYYAWLKGEKKKPGFFKRWWHAFNSDKPIDDLIEEGEF